MIIGNFYIDLHGNCEIFNETTGSKVKIYVHRQGWTSKNKFRVEGQVLDKSGKVHYEIEGNWIKYLSILDPTTKEELYRFDCPPLPEDCLRQYGFSHFNINQNWYDKSMDTYLPHTDCRYRPDQRLMEIGDYERAKDEKLRLEQRQRLHRKERADKKIEYKPLWFSEKKESNLKGDKNDLKCYIFNHKYWEKRKRNDWSDLPDLFGNIEKVGYFSPNF